jgi:hypothetical protein
MICSRYPILCSAFSCISIKFSSKCTNSCAISIYNLVQVHNFFEANSSVLVEAVSLNKYLLLNEQFILNLEYLSYEHGIVVLPS